MSISKSHFVADGAERLKTALDAHRGQLQKTIAEKYAVQLASATTEEKHALEQQMRHELDAQMKRLKPSWFALYAAPAGALERPLKS